MPAFRLAAATGYDHTAVLILALDTTTRGGSVAVCDDDRLIAVMEGDVSRTHGERLPAELAATLSSAGAQPTDLRLLAVGSGPGAFTGLRIGIAAIQGLAVVLGVPVVGISALEALAVEAFAVAEVDSSDEVVAWMDAARSEVFAGRFRRDGGLDPIGVIALGAATVATPSAHLARLDAAVDRAPVFIGEGAIRYRAALATWHPAARVLPHPATLAPTIARMGWRCAARGEAGLPHAVQPLYVRRPDAELQRDGRRSDPP